MAKLNEFLNKINDDNTFLEIKKIVNDYKLKNPNKKVLSLGVGDVSKPIAKPIIKAMHKAIDDLSNIETFKGYGESFGYNFLKEKILENDYKEFNFTLDEIYISDGTKTDSTNILELFDIKSKICIADPMYPIYRNGALCLNRDANVLETNENFITRIPKEKYDIIYICSPNNPTGICYTYSDLDKWVKYAIANDSIILFDNVYFSFISSKNIPKSIYEIENAKKVAIEFRSFSKNASFTGVRCSYYVIPNEINKNINNLWKKRTINRFNGVNYIAQRGAEAVYEEESQKYIEENINYYKENAKILRKGFEQSGFTVYGGIDSPFIWIKIKNNMLSKDFFEFMLNELNIVIIPGIVFGKKGDKFFRVSALASRNVILESLERITNFFKEN